MKRPQFQSRSHGNTVAKKRQKRPGFSLLTTNEIYTLRNGIKQESVGQNGINPSDGAQYAQVARESYARAIQDVQKERQYQSLQNSFHRMERMPVVNAYPPKGAKRSLVDKLSGPVGVAGTIAYDYVNAASRKDVIEAGAGKLASGVEKIQSGGFTNIAQGVMDMAGGIASIAPGGSAATLGSVLNTLVHLPNAETFSEAATNIGLGIALPLAGLSLGASMNGFSILPSVIQVGEAVAAHIGATEVTPEHVTNVLWGTKNPDDAQRAMYAGLSKEDRYKTGLLWDTRARKEWWDLPWYKKPITFHRPFPLERVEAL